MPDSRSLWGTQVGAPSPRRGPPHPTNKILWSQNETKHLKSVSFLLLLLSPLKCRKALKGGECGAKEPFRNVSFHVSEPGQPANQMLRGCLCHLPTGTIYKGIISISCLPGPSSFIKAFPHAFISSLNPLLPFNQGFFNFQKKRGHGDLGRSG